MHFVCAHCHIPVCKAHIWDVASVYLHRHVMTCLGGLWPIGRAGLLPALPPLLAADSLSS